jgi:predicted aspartyl protease
MSGGTGHFDQRRNACLKLHLCGTKHDDPGVEFEGVIDTGFTGFVSLPMQHAIALGLPLDSTVSVTFADGKSAVRLVALARVWYGGVVGVGAVTLEPGAVDILIGMDFLRHFKLALFISEKHILLLPEEVISEIEEWRGEDAGASGEPPVDSGPSGS